MMPPLLAPTAIKAGGVDVNGTVTEGALMTPAAPANNPSGHESPGERVKVAPVTIPIGQAARADRGNAATANAMARATLPAALVVDEESRIDSHSVSRLSSNGKLRRSGGLVSKLAF